jgi:hypothetical protein
MEQAEKNEKKKSKLMFSVSIIIIIITSLCVIPNVQGR